MLSLLSLSLLLQEAEEEEEEEEELAPAACVWDNSPFLVSRGRWKRVRRCSPNDSLEFAAAAASSAFLFLLDEADE